MKKGISPLIAVATMIALVIAAASLIIIFTKSFSKDTMKEATEIGSMVAECEWADMRLDASYSNGWLTGSVYNNGKQVIKGMNIIFMSSNGTTFRELTNDSIGVSESYSFSINTTKPNRIHVELRNCPTVKRTVKIT